MPRKLPGKETQFYRAQVGELVWCWRMEREMSQKEVADKAGVSYAYLSRLENGRGKVEIYHTDIVSLAAALGVSLADLTPKEGQAKL